MSDHTPNEDHSLTEAELTHSRFPALMVLSAIRGDAEAMADQVELASEHITVGQMIEAMAIELAAVAIATHESPEKAEQALLAAVRKMNAGTI